MCLIFVVPGIQQKVFHTEFFPNYGMLSYQALEYEKPQAHGSTEETSQEFRALSIGILDNAPFVFEIESEEQCTELSKITITLDEVHSLERLTCEQSQSTKWQCPEWEKL